VKGGEKPTAAQSVGSRAVVNSKTLAEMGANDKLIRGQRQPPLCGGLSASLGHNKRCGRVDLFG
jgi:hypothetical protein